MVVLVVSQFNCTSTPKGSYSAKTGDNDCKINSSRYRLRTALCESNSLSSQVWTKCPTRPDTRGAPRGGCSHAPLHNYRSHMAVRHKPYLFQSGKWPSRVSRPLGLLFSFSLTWDHINVLEICQTLKLLWHFDFFVNTGPYGSGNFKMLLLLQFWSHLSQTLWSIRQP